MKNRRALMVATVVGLSAVLLTGWHLSREERRLRGQFEMITVVVASKDIRRFERIEEDMISFQKIPKPYVQPLAVLAAERSKVVGVNMADATIKKGEQLTKTKLALLGEGGISPIIPSKSRACTIAVNEITGVGGLIRNRDTVDIIGTFRTVDEKTRVAKNVSAVTLLQNVPVLAVGKNYVFDRPQAVSGENKKMFSNNNSIGFSNITLLLSPRECMDLAVAQQVGELTLSLRSYHDRFKGKQDPELKEKRSTTGSVTGLKSPVQISKQPRWMEVRGNEASFAP